MYCSKCGAQNPDDATFCSKCGNNLISIKPEKKGITRKLGKMGIPGFRSRKLWKMALATIAYFFIGMTILGAIFGGNNNSNSPSISPQIANSEKMINLTPEYIIPTLQEMPQNSIISGESFNAEKTYGERLFIINGSKMHYIVTNYDSIEDAKYSYDLAKKQFNRLISNSVLAYPLNKLDDIYLGNEGFIFINLYAYEKIIIFRKANIVVQMSSDTGDIKYFTKFVKLE